MNYNVTTYLLKSKLELGSDKSFLSRTLMPKCAN